VRYLNECGVNLDPFFQIIWRHAFCTELLKRRYRIDDADKAKGLWDSFVGRLQPNKQRAIEYLRSLGVDLWPEMETRVQEIAKTVESQLGAELQANSGVIKSKLRGQKTITDEERSEVRSTDDDPLGALCRSYYANAIDEWGIIQAYLATMYKLGVVGIKTTSQAPVRWAMTDAPSIAPAALTMESHIEIHPMLYRALGVNPKQ
jgi:hypothetical protein